jgi:hypothetical protein
VEFANGDGARNEARVISRARGAGQNESAPETGALRRNQRFTSASLHVGRVKIVLKILHVADLLWKSFMAWGAALTSFQQWRTGPHVKIWVLVG